MLGRFLDRLIGAFSPRAGLERLTARASLEAIDALIGGSTQPIANPIPASDQPVLLNT
jgi:hypothetical protein